MAVELVTVESGTGMVLMNSLTVTLGSKNCFSSMNISLPWKHQLDLSQIPRVALDHVSLDPLDLASGLR